MHLENIFYLEIIYFWFSKYFYFCQGLLVARPCAHHGRGGHCSWRPRCLLPGNPRREAAGDIRGSNQVKLRRASLQMGNTF